jgi:hypothetical protein
MVFMQASSDWFIVKRSRPYSAGEDVDRYAERIANAVPEPGNQGITKVTKFPESYTFIRS